MYVYLCCLCFASPSRASRGTSKLEMECSSECEVASVCERSDHQSPCVPQILIAVCKLRIHCSHQ